MRGAIDDELVRLCDLSLDLFCVAGFDGYFRVLNRAWEHTLGYPREGLLEKDLLDLTHPNDVEAMREALAGLERGEELVGFEARVICADGSLRWLEWNASPRPDEGVFYGVARDITDPRIANDELSGLRRVATLAAQGVQPQELFAVVAEEIGRVMDVPLVRVMRYESDDAATQCASFSAEGTEFPFGTQSSLEGTNVLQLVRETSKAARIDDYSELEGEIAEIARDRGIRSAVGTPIVVAGRPWGAVVASSSEQLPDDAEVRLTDFTELLATAIASAESYEALARLADEQAALRRVATLVGQGVRPAEMFGAVTEEVARIVEIPAVSVVRYEADGTATELANFFTGGRLFPVGVRMKIEGTNILRLVRDSGAAARIDDYSHAKGEMADVVRRAGVRSTVGVPIVVAGRVWGTMVGSTTAPEPLPNDTESRLADFTELLATAIGNAESREALERLADEQAALRRIAVLVAQEPAPDEVFTAVTEAVGPLLRADLAAMHIFPGDGTATTIAGWSASGPMLPIGSRLSLDGDSTAARIFRTGGAARMDSYVDVEGESAEIARGLRLRSTVGAPIVVDGKLWGALMAATRGDEPLPEDAETRIAAFTELVATAISNAHAREALRRLADEQTALRRVATLVAEGVPPADIFSAVSEEVGRLFGSGAAVLRFEHDPPAVVFVGISQALDIPIETRWEFQDGMASAEAYRTGRSARVDAMDWSSGDGPVASTARRLGIVSTVVSPIVVDGRLWGAMSVLSREEVLPPDSEKRLEKFTELVGTAIANADSRAELAKSRRRIVAASDEARRRIERDLHDGAQQQLVALRLEASAVEAALPPDGELEAQLAHITNGLTGVLDDLVEISRGIHPAILSHGGLDPALRTLARRSPVPVELDVRIASRLPEQVEVAVYYVVSEALANVAKHAHASIVHVEVVAQEEMARLTIRDDGVGGVDMGQGSGLVGLQDRVEALGGRLGIDSAPASGTLLAIELPLDVEPLRE